MQIYIDTADIDEIKEAFSWGIVDGVTTNPSLIKKAAEKHLGQGGDLKDYIKRILETAGDECPVSLEVIGTTREAMVNEAFTLFETFNPVAENVVIKVPVNPRLPGGDDDEYAGLKVLKKLDEENIPTNCTLIMTAEQALLAAKAGADFVSPFAGRVDDDLRKRAGIDFDKTAHFPADGMIPEGVDTVLDDNGIVSGVDLVLTIVEVFTLYDIESEIIAASIRNAQQVRELAETGVDIATIPFSVIQSMISHPKTEEGMAGFVQDVVPEYRALFGK